MARAKNKPLPQLTPEEIARFHRRTISVPDETSCWEWGGVKMMRRSRPSYGIFVIFRAKKKLVFSTHRIAYFIHNHEDPGNLLVAHTCDNPPCCRPSHLFKATGADNSADMVRKGRAASGDRNGKALHPESALRGEKNGNSRFSQQDVKLMRDMCSTGMSCTEVGKIFRTCSATVRGIVTRNTWKHIE